MPMLACIAELTKKYLDMELHYMIASGSSTKTLKEEVESRIKMGWIPQGGVSVANASSSIFLQAMIQKSE